MPESIKDLPYNASVLLQELKDAGISVGGCDGTGKVQGIDGITDISDEPDVIAVLQGHNKAGYDALISAIKDETSITLDNLPDWVSFTPDEAESAINTNVTDLNSAKVVLIKMAKTLCVLRNLLLQEIVANARK